MRKYPPKNPVFTKYVLCLSPCITSEELNDAQFYRWPFWPFLYDLRRKSAPLPSSKKKDEKIAKIAIIHVACPQTFFFFFVFVVGCLFVCSFAFLFFFFSVFFDNLTVRKSRRSAREWVRHARKKHPSPCTWGEQIPHAFYFYMRAQGRLKYRVSEEGRIHALFAIFLTSFFPLPLQATYSSLLWLYFLSWGLYRAAYFPFSLCRPFSFLNFLL